MTFSRWVALGFGAGLSPVAPGTVGTLVGLFLVYGLKGWCHRIASPESATLLLSVLFITYTCLSLFCVKSAIPRGNPDAGWIVADEISGFWLSVMTLDVGSQHIAYWVLAFVFFRVLDITKPGPIGLLDRWSKKLRHPWAISLGIFADDWLAGLGAGAGVALLQYYFSP